MISCSSSMLDTFLQTVKDDLYNSNWSDGQYILIPTSGEGYSLTKFDESNSQSIIPHNVRFIYIIKLLTGKVISFLQKVMTNIEYDKIINYNNDFITFTNIKKHTDICQERRDAGGYTDDTGYHRCPDMYK
jgi:hypothetical protein